jgi:glc operon protein GlcG
MQATMKRVSRGLLLWTAALALAAGTVQAQTQELEKFVINADAAKRAKVRDEISLATARRIADDCLQQAAERKMGVSVAILNPAGNIVYAVRADGQGPVQIETALMKAKTALYLRDSTHAWQNRLDLNTAVRYLPMDQFFNSGGLPIVVNDVLIGAVGAGGMPPSAQWSDEVCIHNALTKVIGPQPPLAPFIAPGAPAGPAR